MSSTTRRLRPLARPALAIATGLTATLALAGCGSGSEPAAGTTSATQAEQTGHHHELTLDDAWAKAGSGMTAAFGTIHNPGSHPITIVKGSSPEAGTVQLHTMEQQADGSMTMAEKKGGFVVPAGGTHTLAPGGDHLMLIDLPKALVNGDDVHLTVTASDGETFEWTVPVRSFAGAEETYQTDGTDSMHGMGGTATSTGTGH